MKKILILTFAATLATSGCAGVKLGTKAAKGTVKAGGAVVRTAM